MLNDVFPEFGGEAYRSGRAVRLTLYLPDADAAWTKALTAGCKVAAPLRDQFWGDRYGELEDPFAYVWAIATHLEDLTGAEIEDTPDFGEEISGSYLLGMAKVKGKVKILLDIDRVLSTQDLHNLNAILQ